MFNSFNSALSSLKAHSTAVDSVGNNLANVNTSGFKGTDVAFKDLVAESLTGSETGMGVSRPITVRNFSQGSVQSSNGPLDAAIQGNGFFVVKNGNNTLYTRDGSFRADAEGYVVTLTGERVQQYVNGNLQDIRIPNTATQATPTANMNIFANLNASAPIGAESRISSPIEVVDSLGVRHTLTATFEKTAANEWDYSITLPPGDFATPPSPFVPQELATGTIQFGTDGKIAIPDPLPTPTDVDLDDLASGAADFTVAFSLFDSLRQPTFTQFAEASDISEVTQDGISAAQIISVGMGDGGRVLARYGNGQTNAIAALAIALVGNPDSLTGAGNNNFRVSADSAEPTYNVAEMGGRGKIKAGSLEGSNVDIAKEFTNLIVYQRGYQANSRVITTADEMSQETLNLKR